MRGSAIARFTLSIVGFVALLQACATAEDSKVLSSTKVVRVSSHSTVISRARIVETQGHVVLEGELIHRYPVRGAIPGHIHVEVLNARDEIVRTARFTYPQGSGNSRTSRFRFILPPNIPSPGVARVIHHDGRSHAPPDLGPVWSDGEKSEEP